MIDSLLVVHSLAVSLVFASPSSPKIDGTVLRQIERKSGPDAEQFAFVGDQTRRPDRQLVFVHMQSQPTAPMLARLRALGADLGEEAWVPPVGNHPDGYLIADVPADAIESVAAIPEVTLIRSGERRFVPLRNDVAGGSGPLGVNARALQALGFDGAGVRIAILDSSLDLAHPDFPTPIAAVDYSAFPALDPDVRSLITGHGTHVTGSVLGRGTASSGLYRGQAPAADLVFLKIGNDSDSSATEAAMAAAVRAAVDVYQADVITASYGGFGLYQDGSEEIEQAADYAFSQGALVFFSAGNSAGSRIHVSGTAPAGGLTSFIQVDVGSIASTTLMFELIWSDGIGVTNDLDLHYYDSAHVEITSDIVLTEHAESSRGTECDESYKSGAISGPSTYFVKVENHSATPQFFHVFSFGNRATFASPDPRYTVVIPSIADEAISVAAYCSRDAFPNWCGSTQNFGQTLGSVASFSSRGPRIGDDGQKPTIAAPGTAVISALDSDRPFSSSLWIADDGVTDCNGPAHYCALQGTSMACPTAAGSSALLLSAFPALKGHPAIVRDLVRRTADAGGTWNDSSGYGFIDVLDATHAAVLATALDAGDFPVTQVTPAAFAAHATVTVEGVDVTSGLGASSFVATIGGSSAAVLDATYDSGLGTWTLTLDPPSLAVGAHDVAVHAIVSGLTTSDATASGGYVVREPVRVLSIAPSEGPIAGGTTLTITGTGYTATPDTTVTIGGGAAASVTVLSDTTIEAITEAHAAGLVDVAVANSFGTDTLAASFDYFDPVSLADVSPAFGSDGGGTAVTITGGGFTNDGDTAVTIGGANAASFHVVDATTITATTDAGTAGLADVTVTNGHGSATLAASFEYLGPDATCLWGTVNAAAGPVTNVLFVNGGVGDAAHRRVTLPIGDPFMLTMVSSPSRATSPFVLYVWLAHPTPATVRVQPFGIGCTGLPTPLTPGSPQPAIVFNNIGHTAQLGSPTYPSHAAPTTVVNRPGGLTHAIRFTLQGILLDNASAGSRPASVTNGIDVDVH
ncbi:MAG: S8 family serine peptidase [Planctomycetes bacterium]|nr:S8 family serine peptidase [Planctomycetota bacterium]MBI3847169.1 S8 family serine peptidase [Planctomycetota bacterium]